MTLTITLNKTFGIRALLLALAVGSTFSAYKYGYNKGLTDMARYAAQFMKEVVANTTRFSSPVLEA